VRTWGRHREDESGRRAENAAPVALVDFSGLLDQAYARAAFAVYPRVDAIHAE
jgi:hypothetical protein